MCSYLSTRVALFPSLRCNNLHNNRQKLHFAPDLLGAPLLGVTAKEWYV